MLVKDVQVELFQSEQLPLEDQVSPAARKMAAACECDILVTAWACWTTTTPGTSPTARAISGTSTRRRNFMKVSFEQAGAEDFACSVTPESY
jgi:hypothetical protein